LDSASDYGVEAETGAGIVAALNKGVCRREELWITSKLWNTYHRRKHVRPALERTLKDLRVDYLDLFHIHFPISLEYVPIEKRYPPGWMFDLESAAPRMQSVRVPIAETWDAMESLVRAGLVRNIGVCNFNCTLLRELFSFATIRPSVVQVELHPLNSQEKLLRFCREENISVTAFSPLGAASYVSLGMAKDSDSVLTNPVVVAAATRLKRTPAQVVLRWAIQRGTSIVVKSANRRRLIENQGLFDFTLSDSELKDISGLNRNRRFNDPGEFCESAFGAFHPIFE